MSSEEKFDLYRYKPVKSAALIFAVIFTASSVALLGQLLYLCRVYRRRGLPRKVVRSLFNNHICLLLGCMLEAAGYYVRIVSSNNRYDLMPYILQSCFVLVAPALMAASIYMVFGRMLRTLQLTNLSFVPARFLTTIFVTGDLISFLAQCGGGGLMGKEETRNLGTRVTSIGLILQLIFFGLFLVTEIRFRLQAAKTSFLVKSLSSTWSTLNMTLLLSSILILVRSVVRLVEFFQGFTGYIISREWFLYVFDAVPMALVPIFFMVTYWNNSIFELEREVDNIKFEGGSASREIELAKISLS